MPRELHACRVRPVKIRHYVATMESWGHSAAELLAGTGIAAEQLSNPAFLVRLEQCKTVVANIIRLTGDQGIGFKIGGHADLSNLGVACQAVISCRTVRDSLLLWARYSNALLGTLISVKLDDGHPDRWALTFNEVIPMGFMYNFCMEEYLMIMRVIGAALSHHDVRFQNIELSYPAPTHHADYEAHLGCVPRFNRPLTRVTFDGPHLDLPLPGRDEAFNEMCRQHCSQILRQLDQESDLPSRLRSLFFSTPGHIPTSQQAADELQLSARTLRRRLLALSTSYQRIVDDYREETAREYLAHSHCSIKELSYLLGFRDSNTFMRMFKQWTGHTATEYRRLQGIARTTDR